MPENAAPNCRPPLSRAEILRWLLEDDPQRLEVLWRQADELRRRYVGDEVHLRGLIEISNYCARHCHYCGIRADNPDIERYRMSRDEILECARQAESFGYGTVVIQAGEDYGLTKEWVADLVREIKRQTDLAVTLSLGERREDELRAWRAAGADRYLLRFETSNEALYQRIHPPLPGRWRNRFEILRLLRELGYEVGSGVMIGIPGQTFTDLAEDILWFARLDLDMIGVGPFIPHPATPLGKEAAWTGNQQALTDESTRPVGEATVPPPRGDHRGVKAHEDEPPASAVNSPFAIRNSQFDSSTLPQPLPEREGSKEPPAPPDNSPFAIRHSPFDNSTVPPPRGDYRGVETHEDEPPASAANSPFAIRNSQFDSSTLPQPLPEREGNKQVPPSELMTYKVLALARLVCPRANIPSTTALATLNLREGRELGLTRGANVVMPNVTPVQYRSKYEIYPSKACLHETAGACQLCMRARIESLGRRIGRGRGDSPNRLRRASSAMPVEVSP